MFHSHELEVGVWTKKEGSFIMMHFRDHFEAVIVIPSREGKSLIWAMGMARGKIIR